MISVLLAKVGYSVSGIDRNNKNRLLCRFYKILMLATQQIVMTNNSESIHVLQSSLELPCGAILKNRIAKSPMSDSLADGGGDPTEAQIRLYERWAEGGAAVSFIGEVQGDPRFPEKPGNLVLGAHSNQNLLQLFTSRAVIEGAHLWPQIGHAGALSHPTDQSAKGAVSS
jgi:2,4-dienoyl-CoA reductase-like NADH-dependent reductase (Old Yellow Enzyme family)